MIKRLLIKFAVFFLMGVIVLVGTVGVGYAQGLVEYALILDGYNDQIISYRDDSDKMPGEFHAQVQTESDGSASGSVTATWTDQSLVSHEVEINITGTKDFHWDRYGNLEGLDLNGRGKYVTDGKEQTFLATVKIDWADSDPGYGGDGVIVGIIDTSLVHVLPDDLHIGPVARTG